MDRDAAMREMASASSQVTTHTWSQASWSGDSMSLIASTLAAGAPAAASSANRARTASRTRGWTIASRSRRAAGSAKTIRASSRESIVPKRRVMAARASPSFWRTSRAIRSASIAATPSSRSIPATVLLPQPMFPVSPITFTRASSHSWARLQARLGIARSQRALAWYGLAMRAEVGRALAGDNPRHRPAAAQARSAGPLINHEPLRVPAWLPIRADVVAEAGPTVGDPLAEDGPDRPMQAPDLRWRQRVRAAQRVQACPPQRFVGIDVAHASDERLIEKQALEPRRSTPEPFGEAHRAEAGGEGLRSVSREDIPDAIPRPRLGDLTPRGSGYGS